VPDQDIRSAELQLLGSAGRDVDLPDRNLLGQSQGVCRRGAMWHHGLAASRRQRLDNLLRCRRACPESARHGRDVDPPCHTQQPAFLGQAGKCLIHGRPGAQVQELLGRQHASLGQGLGMQQDGFRKCGHGACQRVRSVARFLTLLLVLRLKIQDNLSD